MTHLKTSKTLLVLGALLLTGCDATNGGIYQSMGALNGGPGDAAPSDVVDTRAVVTPEAPDQVSKHLDVGAIVEQGPQPGGFSLSLVTNGSPGPGLPVSTEFVRLTVNAPDLQAPLVTFLSHSATASAATASLSVPLGSDRTLSVAAKDGTGKVLARGALGGLTVESGRYAPLALQLTTQLGSLFGQVLNDMTGTPEPGVTVTIGDTSSVTDQYGVYRLEGLAAGTQTLSFQKAQFEGATRSLEIVASPQTDPATQRLSPL